ncbi:leukocyte elastase inhibitor-like [Aphidius gifuensis]|uniref:leukocyte elastase inhibitor-like n=1 Tax=Aphidius gifuensis TaxID=684658 RepID=UPI001CDCD488|nr:leukocyte elastase inhibitor-like [Aphidius gifuensis]
MTCVENFRDSNLIAIANECKNLEKLNISHCTSITEEGLDAITRIKSLRRLNVSDLKCVTDSFLEKLKGLYFLERDRCTKITDVGFNQFIKNCPDLKRLFTATEDEKSNFICSPISASIALAMTVFGARNDTAKQIRSVLHLSEDDEVNKLGYQHLIDTFNATKNVQLDIANKLFLADDMQVHCPFVSITKDFFRSELQLVDFGQCENARKIINNWCEVKTNNRIKDILQPDDIDPSTRLVIVNAIYFRGSWDSQFNAGATKLEPFNIDQKTQKNVLMMEQKATYHYGYLKKLDAMYVELPYEQLRGYTCNIILKLPKFKIESRMLLDDTLKKIGMVDMFDPNKADFSGISNEPLFVGKVIQKAFIEVNEEGSEAAAATIVTGLIGSMLPSLSRPREIIVNRPFFCAIVATKTGTQLFNARVVDPSHGSS